MTGRRTLVIYVKSPLSVCPAGFLEANAAELVQLIFQTLPVYDSLVLQRAVLAFLRWCCLRNETFLKTVAGALVRLGARNMPKQDAYVLLRWSSEVVSRLQLPEARKAVSKLAECQVRPAILF